MSYLVTCPVCHREVSGTDQVVCLEVERHSCRVVNLKDVPHDTKKIICAVHETCVQTFRVMVAAGQYPSTKSN